MKMELNPKIDWLNRSNFFVCLSPIKSLKCLEAIKANEGTTIYAPNSNLELANKKKTWQLKKEKRKNAFCTITFSLQIFQLRRNFFCHLLTCLSTLFCHNFRFLKKTDFNFHVKIKTIKIFRSGSGSGFWISH